MKPKGYDPKFHKVSKKTVRDMYMYLVLYGGNATYDESDVMHGYLNMLYDLEKKFKHKLKLSYAEEPFDYAGAWELYIYEFNKQQDVQLTPLFYSIVNQE